MVRRISATALKVAVLALLPFAWLAWQPSFVHRSRLDPAAPLYTSNYLHARGFVVPWFITEVAPSIAPVPLTARIMPAGVGILYLVALLSAA